MNHNSMILSLITSMFIALRRWFVSSGYYRLFTVIADFFGKLYKNSFFYRYFTKKPYDEDSGVASAAVNWIFGLFYKLLHPVATRIKDCAKDSLIIRFLGFVLKHWYSISVRYYSMTLFIFAAVRLVVKHIAGPGGFDKYTLLLSILSLVGMLIDVSPAGLYQGCVLKKFVGLPDLGARFPLSVPVKQHIAVTAGIISGSLLGLSVLMPYWFVAVGAVLGFILVMGRPKVGVFIIVAFFPFMPTMGVVGLSLLVMFGMFVQYIAGNEAKLRLDGFDFCILVMCGVLAYGVVNSYARMSSIPVAAVYLVFVGTFYIIRRAAADKTFLYGLLDTMLVAALLVSVYGIYQKLSGQADTTWQDTSMFESMGGRVTSTFSNPNVLGEYLLITIPLTMARLFQADRPGRRFAYLGILALQAACMVLTFSRGCWIGLLLSIVVFLMFNGRKTTALLILAACAIPFVLPDVILQRLTSVGNTADSSTSYRVFIWEGTVRMLKDFWYSGIGIGTDAFNTVYPLYALNAIVAPHSHNFYLHILVETGIIGMVVVLCLIRLFYRYLAGAARKSTDMKIVAFGLGTGMLGYLIQGMFDNVWYNYRIYSFFFILLALGAALYDLSKKEKANA